MNREQIEEHAKVVIVGAGFGGLAMAIRLLQKGVDDFVVLDRADDVGGVWHSNTYPGCRCDVASHLYSLSFAPNPNWSNTFSSQPEIRAYLGRVADDHGIRPHLRLGVEVERSAWDEDAGEWRVETSRGTYAGRFLVNAMGPLTEPRLPDVPGLGDFKGEVMHSARWNHDIDLAGKRVASIGTGASAIQYVPEIRKEAERVTVFQRTAPWVLPHGGRPIRDWERALYRRVPFAQRMMREAIYWARELMVFGFVKRPGLMGRLEGLSRSHMDRQISDPELRRKVQPDYTIGCKRLLPSNRWYRALGEDNVELVTEAITEVRERSVVDAAGREHEVDAIVFGTGFHITDAPYARQIVGREGLSLDEFWEGSPKAFLGTSVPGFPNMFLIAGPNTGLGHGSMVFMIEAEVEHVLAAIDAVENSTAKAIELRQPVYEDFVHGVDERMATTVWSTGGCSSFYIDETGRNAAQWPDFTWKFRRLATDFEPAAYEIRTAKPVAVPA